MALIGYARISTTDQELDLQDDALRAAECTRIFVDRCSGATGERAGLAEALAFLREGDMLVVWKLDRLGRSMRNLVQTVEDLDGRGVGLRSLTEQLDTQTPGGRLIFHIFGALAQFERDLILERTAAGLAAARARGKTGGRRPVVTPEKLRRASSHITAGLSVREAAARIKVGKTALYAALEQENAPQAQTAAGTKRRG